MAALFRLCQKNASYYIMGDSMLRPFHMTRTVLRDTVLCSYSGSTIGFFLSFDFLKMVIRGPFKNNQKRVIERR